MKNKLFASILFAGAVLAFAQEETVAEGTFSEAVAEETTTVETSAAENVAAETAPAEEAPAEVPAAVQSGVDLSKPGELCLFAKEPQGVMFKQLKKVKAAKGVYGSVASILPVLEKNTRDLGGNAVINYVGSQRFGFWPWRFVRPVARGIAVSVDNQGRSCQEMGGKSINETISGK